MGGITGLGNVCCFIQYVGGWDHWSRKFSCFVYTSLLFYGITGLGNVCCFQFMSLVEMWVGSLVQEMSVVLFSSSMMWKCLVVLFSNVVDHWSRKCLLFYSGNHWSRKCSVFYSVSGMVQEMSVVLFSGITGLANVWSRKCLLFYSVIGNVCCFGWDHWSRKCLLFYSVILWVGSLVQEMSVVLFSGITGLANVCCFIQ